MPQIKHDKYIILAIIITLFIIILCGYVNGDLQKIFHKRTEQERIHAEKQVIGHFLGSDREFNSDADNITKQASGNGDNITWKILSSVKFKDGKSFEIEFSEDIKKLNGKNIIITGYIFPLESSDMQKHFLLSAYPPSCPYCLPSGATELIEVTTSQPIKFSYDAIKISGKFKLLTGEATKDGMFYQVLDAKNNTINN